MFNQFNRFSDLIEEVSFNELHRDDVVYDIY